MNKEIKLSEYCAKTATLPVRRYLARADVIFAVGGRKQLALLEASGALRRVYPGGIKRARYIRAEVMEAVYGKDVGV